MRLIGKYPQIGQGRQPHYTNISMQLLRTEIIIFPFFFTVNPEPLSLRVHEHLMHLYNRLKSKGLRNNLVKDSPKYACVEVGECLEVKDESGVLQLCEEELVRDEDVVEEHC